MVGAVKGCLFRSINFFLGIFKAKLEFLKWGWTPALFVQEKNPRIIFCYRNGGHVSEQYNIWGKSGEDLIKVAFDIKPVYPKTSTESLIQKQSRGPNHLFLKWRSLLFLTTQDTSPILVPVSVKISVMFCSFSAPWHLTVSGWPQQLSLFHMATFPVSLFPGAASSSSHPLLVTLPSTTSHLSLYRFLSVLKTRCPLLCHPVFSLQWCSHQRHQGLVSGHQQGCCWGHLLLGSWEWRVQAPSTGPLCLQYKTKH